MDIPQAHAFDFIFGHWTVHNKKLRDVTDPTCEEWIAFEGASDVYPILERVGHVDRYYVDKSVAGDPFEGFTLRLFDPSDETWSIWWSSTRAPGRLDPPVVGFFLDGRGTFECEDVIAGRRARVRFEWLSDDLAPLWCQSFSYDMGATWKRNWEMTFRRRDAPNSKEPTHVEQRDHCEPSDAVDGDERS